MVQEGKSQRSTAGTVSVLLRPIMNDEDQWSRVSRNQHIRTSDEHKINQKNMKSIRRPRYTINVDNRLIVSTILRNRHFTALWSYNDDSNTRSSHKLLREYRVARLRFSREHIQQKEQNWSKVMFNYEPKFYLFMHNARRDVYRRPGIRYKQTYFVINYNKFRFDDQ